MFQTFAFFLAPLAAIGIAAASAATTPAATDPGPPMRVFVAGHSFHVFVGPLLETLAKEAGIKDYRNAGVQPIGGSTVIRHWDADPNPVKDGLRSGSVDVLTLSPIWFPDDGIEKFARFGLDHNPNIRITVQEFWMPNDEYNPVYPLDTKKHVDHDATNLADLRKAQEHYHKDLAEYVAGINKKLGKQVLFTVPVGEAVLDLREQMAAGKAPTPGKQSDLFSDSWGHPKDAIKLLDAYCHFAVITHKNPQDLPVSGDAKHQETQRLLQKAAWNAVTHDPLSGVKAD